MERQTRTSSQRGPALLRAETVRALKESADVPLAVPSATEVMTLPVVGSRVLCKSNAARLTSAPSRGRKERGKRKNALESLSLHSIDPFASNIKSSVERGSSLEGLVLKLVGKGGHGVGYVVFGIGLAEMGDGLGEEGCDVFSGDLFGRRVSSFFSTSRKSGCPENDFA